MVVLVVCRYVGIAGAAGYGVVDIAVCSVVVVCGGDTDGVAGPKRANPMTFKVRNGMAYLANVFITLSVIID